MNTYYRRAPGIASRVVDGEAFLIKMPENLLFVLNDAASRIWVRADGTRSGDDLTSEGSREATHAFLDEMVERGLFLRSTSPCEKGDVFPQDVIWPEPDDPSESPRIRTSEALVAIGGCDVNAVCVVPFSA